MNNELLSFDEWLASVDMPDGKRRILQAAVKLFAENGFHATSTATIAKEAGLSDAAMFRHFKNKDALLESILTPLFDQLMPNFSEQFVTALHNQATTMNDLIAFIIADRWTFINKNNQVIQILLGEIMSNPAFRQQMVDALTSRFNEVLTILETRLRADQTTSPNVTSLDLVRLIVGQLATHFMMTYKFHAQLDDATVVANIIQLTQKAIRI